MEELIAKEEMKRRRVSFAGWFGRLECRGEKVRGTVVEGDTPPYEPLRGAVSG